MDWQLLSVAVCVIVAAGYVGRQAWRTWSAGRGGCGGGCHCPKATAQPVERDRHFIPVTDLTLRRRTANGNS